MTAGTPDRRITLKLVSLVTAAAKSAATLSWRPHRDNVLTVVGRALSTSHSLSCVQNDRSTSRNTWHLSNTYRPHTMFPWWTTHRDKVPMVSVSARFISADNHNYKWYIFAHPQIIRAKVNATLSLRPHVFHRRKCKIVWRTSLGKNTFYTNPAKDYLNKNVSVHSLPTDYVATIVVLIT